MEGELTSWRGDRDYHDRHGVRALRRAKCIAKHVTPDGSFLDVGCNRGITTRYLLDSGLVQRAIGLELAAGAVAEDLLSDRRFTLIEGDVCDLALQESFDVVFYGAVHHHIVRERGLGAAVAVLQKLAERCNGQMFFETGHISEGGRWAWQRCLRQHFRTDEEHIFFLVQAIEPWLRDFQVIGKFRIHGVRRWLIQFEMGTLTSSHTPTLYDPSCSMPVTTESNEGLVASRSLLAPQHFFAPPGGEPEKVRFQKRRPRFPLVDVDEYEIASQLDSDWAVSPLEYDRSKGIAFPYVDGLPIFEWAARTAGFREAISRQLIGIFNDARRTRLTPRERLLLPAGTSRSLAQMVDLNPTNLIVESGGKVPNLRAVDFERQSNHYLWKNRIHVGRALYRLRCRRLYATYQIVLGVASLVGYLVKYQFLPVRQRIVDRQPSLGSVVSAESHSAIGRALARIFPRLSSL